MSSAKELPKLIEKSADEVKAILAEVTDSNLSDDTKEFVISAINLSLWLPQALVEHKITVSNLRKLVFGAGHSKGSTDTKTAAPKESDEAADDTKSDNSLTSVSTDENTEKKDKPKKKVKGHGRLPHTAYKTAIDYTLTINGC